MLFECWKANSNCASTITLFQRLEELGRSNTMSGPCSLTLAFIHKENAAAKDGQIFGNPLTHKNYGLLSSGLKLVHSSITPE